MNSLFDRRAGCAFLDRLIHVEFADSAELGSYVEVDFLLTIWSIVTPFGMQVSADRRFETDEYCQLVPDAVFDTGGFRLFVEPLFGAVALLIFGGN